MKRILVFAGTTEGRIFSKKAADSGFDVTVSVATEYGKEMLGSTGTDFSLSLLSVLENRLDEAQMKRLVSEFDFVVDATHPYAVQVTENILKACGSSGKKCFRLLRPIQKHVQAENFLEFDSIEEIVVFINREDEKCRSAKKEFPRIFVSTGSKELDFFTKITDFSGRIFVRVLPSVESIQKCTGLGFSRKNIIAMQGPFSAELNEAMFKETQSKILVTKISGKIGGFDEKIIAAQKCGMKILALKTPEEASENVFSDIDSLIDKLKSISS